MKPLICTILTFLSLAPSTWAHTLTVQEQKEVSRGGIVVQLIDTGKSTMKDVVAVGYVEAAPEALWKTITGYEHYPKLFPSILISEVRKREGNTCHHYTLLDYPWPLPDKWVLSETHHEGGAWRITWHRIEGTVKALEGSWQLFPEKNRTLVVYTTRFDPGIALVPQWVVDWGSSQVAPQIIRNLRHSSKP